MCPVWRELGRGLGSGNLKGGTDAIAWRNKPGSELEIEQVAVPQFRGSTSRPPTNAVKFPLPMDVCFGSREGRNKISVRPRSSSSAMQIQGSCCVQMWQLEGWIFLKWTGLFSMTLQMTPR